MKNGERLCVNVCYFLAGEVIEEREFAAYKDVPDNYTKYVVSLAETSAYGWRTKLRDGVNRSVWLKAHLLASGLLREKSSKKLSKLKRKKKGK